MEEVEVSQTSGRLGVQGGDFELALFLDGNPLALVWPDHEGSVGQYLIRAGSAELQAEFRSVQVLLDRGLPADGPLVALAGPFLNVVAAGKYRLTLEPRASSAEFYELNPSAVLPTTCESFYPYGWDLIATLPTDKLDGGRVEHFKQAIGAGQRPVVVGLTAIGGDAVFVIDGHHKLAAYQQLRVDPAVLLLARHAPGVDPRQLESTFGGYTMWSDYRDKVPWPE